MDFIPLFNQFFTVVHGSFRQFLTHCTENKYAGYKNKCVRFFTNISQFSPLSYFNFPGEYETFIPQVFFVAKLDLINSY